MLRSYYQLRYRTVLDLKVTKKQTSVVQEINDLIKTPVNPWNFYNMYSKSKSWNNWNVKFLYALESFSFIPSPKHILTTGGEIDHWGWAIITKYCAQQELPRFWNTFIAMWWKTTAKIIDKAENIFKKSDKFLTKKNLKTKI